MTDARWPALPYAEWKDTYATLHMWTQVVGKIALAHDAAARTTRGASRCRSAPRGPDHADAAFTASRRFTLEFDFVDHQLVLRIV